MSTKPLALLIALGLGTASPLAAYATAMPDTPKTDAAATATADIKANPFYAPSTLPYQYPAFDKIKDTDFAPAFDTFFLDDAAFAGLAAGTLAAGAFRNGPAALDADDRILYDAATGHILFDADGSAAAAAVLFATVTPGLVLTNADFFGY